MKKLFAMILSLAILATLCVGCGGNKEAPTNDKKPTASEEKKETAAPSEEVITLRMGSGSADSTPEVQAAHYMAERLEELSGGTMKIDVLANGLAGSDLEILEGQQIGSMDISLMSAVLSNFDSAMMLLEYDFLFVNDAHRDAVLHGELGEELYARIAETCGVKILAPFNRTPRLISATKKIETLDDLHGVKIRVPEAAARTAVWTALGASPTPMSYNEVYTSISTGVIEGQENPIANITGSKFYEVCPYLMMSNHLYGFQLLNISNITWNKLSDEQKGWVAQAAEEAAERNNELVLALEADQLAEAAAHMEVVEVDVSSWREAVKDVYKQFSNDPNYAAFEDFYTRIVELGKDFE